MVEYPFFDHGTPADGEAGVLQWEGLEETSLSVEEEGAMLEYPHGVLQHGKLPAPPRLGALQEELQFSIVNGVATLVAPRGLRGHSGGAGWWDVCLRGRRRHMLLLLLLLLLLGCRGALMCRLAESLLAI